MRRFVVDGIRLERRVILIGGDETLESTEILGKIAESGDLYPSRVDQVVYYSAHDVYRKDGSFDRYRAITFIRNQIRLARTDGFRGLHLVQDVGALPVDSSEVRDIVAFEAGIGTLLSDVPRSVLCLFHRNRTSSELLVAALDTHPTCLIDDRLHLAANPFYRAEIALGTPRYDEVARERLAILERLRRTDQESGTPPATTLLHRVTRWTDDRKLSRAELLHSVLRDIGDYLGAGCGRAYLVDRSKDVLVASGGWTGTRGTDDSDAEAITAGAIFHRGEKAPGQAWLNRRPVWVVDPAEVSAEDIPSGQFAAEGRVSIPLLGGGGVEAVLDFLFSERRAPNERSLADLEPVARLAGEAVGRIRTAEELGAERVRTGKLLGSTGEAVIVTDGAGRIRSWTRRAAAILGQEGSEVPVGRSVADLLPRRIQDRILDGIRTISSGDSSEIPASVEFQIPQGEGRGWLSGVTLSSVSTSGDGSVAVILRAGGSPSEELSRIPLRYPAREPESAPLLVLSPDLRWGGPAIVSASAEFCIVSGFGEAELVGRTLQSLTDPRGDSLVVDQMEEGFASNAPFDVDLTIRDASGNAIHLALEILPVHREDGVLGHFIVHGREEIRDEVASDLLRRADTDPLTGLANRFLFDKMLGRAIERAQKNPNIHFGVLFLDLDRFKQINDSRGHVTGDQLLVAVARELEQAVRPGDVVARFGGDEFVVLVDLVGGLREVVAVAERISERLALPVAIEGEVFSLSVSIGIAVSDTGYSTIEEVLRDADIAMYQAKQQGGGSYRIFDAKLREGIASANRVRNALQESLARGEFRLYYQPLVDLHSNRITGLEALLRWEHPERGTVSASEFITLAEDSGLILPIGRWVIREACRQLASWKSQLGSEVDLTLSVNLSSRELLSPELPTWIQRSLDETGAEPASLRIEIPESFISDSSKEIAERFRELRDLGIQISIGDFGGGDLSLRQLLQFPVDTLKIDCRLFFNPSALPGAPGDAEVNERVLRSILAVAASLEIEVVASAIETRVQWETLRRLSFRVGQGYLFSKPVEATGAQSLFRKIWSDRAPKDSHQA